MTIIKNTPGLMEQLDMFTKEDLEKAIQKASATTVAPYPYPTVDPFSYPSTTIAPYFIGPSSTSAYIKPAVISVPNKKVAVEPFSATETATAIKGGVMVPVNQAALTPLKVVFASENYAVGNIVFVRSKIRTTTTYGKEVFEALGEKFILLPEEDVVLVDRSGSK